MRTFSLILRTAASILIVLISLAFVVIEGTLLFTGDFLLYENPIIAFFQLILRLVIPLITLTVGIFTVIKTKRSFLFESITFFSVALAMSPFLSNNFGIYFIALATLYLLSNILFNLSSKKTS